MVVSRLMISAAMHSVTRMSPLPFMTRPPGYLWRLPRTASPARPAGTAGEGPAPRTLRSWRGLFLELGSRDCPDVQVGTGRERLQLEQGPFLEQRMEGCAHAVERIARLAVFFCGAQDGAAHPPESPLNRRGEQVPLRAEQREQIRRGHPRPRGDDRGRGGIESPPGEFVY